MKKGNKIYYTAQELSEVLGVSLTYAYKIIRKLNQELEKDGFIVLTGKISRAYFDKRFYGHGA